MLCLVKYKCEKTLASTVCWRAVSLNQADTWHMQAAHCPKISVLWVRPLNIVTCYDVIETHQRYLFYIKTHEELPCIEIVQPFFSIRQRQELELRVTLLVQLQLQSLHCSTLYAQCCVTTSMYSTRLLFRFHKGVRHGPTHGSDEQTGTAANPRQYL